VIAVGGSAKGGAGALVYVFSPSGELKEKHPAPADAPTRVAFGDSDLASLYVTTEGGHLYRSKDTGLKGAKR
jgi:sugar lactone lactonase YvrE